MDVLRPSYEKVADIKDAEDKARSFEKQAVLVSLENLMTFPFVRERVESGDLTLHGLWHNIAEGGLESYDAEVGAFSQV
jgi:carbonic anhydrase